MTQQAAIDIVRDELVKLGNPVSEDDAGFILWNYTGWPGFFDSGDVEAHIREQVRESLRGTPE